MLEKREAVAIHDELTRHRDKALRKARQLERLMSTLTEARDVEVVPDVPPPPEPQTTAPEGANGATAQAPIEAS